jgi:hypothetical protein
MDTQVKHIRIHVVYRTASLSGETVTRVYVGLYDEDVMNGELVRNLCVNLAIDPDTDNGKTKNIAVKFACSEVIWEYVPWEPLNKSMHSFVNKVHTESVQGQKELKLIFEDV